MGHGNSEEGRDLRCGRSRCRAAGDRLLVGTVIGAGRPERLVTLSNANLSEFDRCVRCRLDRAPDGVAAVPDLTGLSAGVFRSGATSCALP